MVKTYRARPCEIEAVEWTGKNRDEIAEFCGDKATFMVGRFGWPRLVFRTLEGEMSASTGDFIIKGLRGEFYPCKPDVFHKKYEELFRTDFTPSGICVVKEE